MLISLKPFIHMCFNALKSEPGLNILHTIYSTGYTITLLAFNMFSQCYIYKNVDFHYVEMEIRSLK